MKRVGRGCLFLILIPALLLPICNSAPIRTTPKKLGPGRLYTSVERMGIEHLKAVNIDRLGHASRRRKVRPLPGFTDYRAILHAHASDSSHTGGNREELLAAAKRTGVRVIMLTDHVRKERDFINDSWRGIRDGVLFIPGAESEGFLAYPIRSIKGLDWKTREDYVSLIKNGGGNIFLSHVEERLDWPTQTFDGLEIYNHHTDVKDEAEFTLRLRGSLTDPGRLAEIENALKRYPQEIFGAQQDYLAEIIAKWDRDTQSTRLTGVAANDCHHNQWFKVSVKNDESIEIGFIGSGPTTRTVSADSAAGVRALTRGRKPGDLVAFLDLDPYDRSLTYVTTHVLAPALNEAEIRAALRSGHAYVSHDWLCDPTGFAFTAERSGKTVGIQGDEVKLADELRLRVTMPLTCRIKFFRNGKVEFEGRRLEFEKRPSAPGVYRIEAWLDLDGEQRPWIYSNPIYVR